PPLLETRRRDSAECSGVATMCIRAGGGLSSPTSGSYERRSSLGGDGSGRQATMDDYALVLNAGSSSLKFCVYEGPGGESRRIGARGQIDGIGTAPHLSVVDGAGKTIATEALDSSMVEGRESVEVLLRWLGTRYGNARVRAV